MAIQALITASGLTRRQIAAELVVSEATVSRWANGQIKVPSERVQPLARLLCVTADAILSATPATRAMPKRRGMARVEGRAA